MLDRRYVFDNPETVKQNCRNRAVQADVDHFVELENRRKLVQSQVEDWNRRANDVAKSIGKAQTPEERDRLKEDGRRFREETLRLKAELESLDAEADGILRGIPNLTHPDVPIGLDHRVLFDGKTPVRKFDFKPLDHVTLGQKLDLIDFEAGARVAGHGFYFLRNEAVLLELALQRYALEILLADGFTPTITPDLARTDVLQGTGYIPRGPETQIYSIENSDLNLIATAEITLGGTLADAILDADQLPIKVCGISHCFRTEAGAHGRESRGLYRVHQFTKVEMFAFTLPGESDSMLDHLRDLECSIFDGLGLPYHVVDTGSADLGGPAYRKYDLEAWMPGRGEAGEWGEVTSTSNCTDFQARRLGIRYRIKGEKGTRLVHTLNGTAVAVSRALLAILENYQQADGSILIPEVLRPFVGKDRIASRP